MKKEFVPYEQALALKKLGFNEPCLARQDFEIENGGHFLIGDYLGDEFLSKQVDYSVLIPLYQQAFRWFREKHKLRGFIGWRPNIKKWDFHIIDLNLNGIEYSNKRTLGDFKNDLKFDNFEEAELECIKKLIEVVNEKIK